MAITHPYTQHREYKSNHWLVYKKFVHFDDSTGNDFIQLQQCIRNAVSEAQEILKPHGIYILDARSSDMYNINSYDRVYKVAIGFENKEDLLMAKLLLTCDE